ncbi:hypothetical protein CGI57_22150 [Vibrio parahaemolyticus]|nr:hypothetical protein CGI57_22150 [Vibrio parahaemolyticus]
MLCGSFGIACFTP